MKKIVLSTVAGAALLASTVGGAFAADHSQPGVPGTPGCQGQTTAYIAQLGQEEGIHGFANVANVAGLTVQQAHDLVRAYCAGQV